MNTRPATCRICKSPLDPGQGHDWRERELVSPGYLCDRCNEIARAYLRKRRAIAPALADLRRLIAGRVPGAPVAMSMAGEVHWIDEAALCQMYLNSLMDIMGLAGPFIVNPLLRVLQQKEVFNYETFQVIANKVADVVQQHTGDKFPTIPPKQLHQRIPNDQPTT